MADTNPHSNGEPDDECERVKHGITIHVGSFAGSLHCSGCLKRIGQGRPFMVVAFKQRFCLDCVEEAYSRMATLNLIFVRSRDAKKENGATERGDGVGNSSNSNSEPHQRAVDGLSGSKDPLGQLGRSSSVKATGNDEGAGSEKPLVE